MTSLPPSASEAPSAFDRLDPLVKRWIWDQDWAELRDVQSRAINAIMNGHGDLLISAATAAGKTEAAFLPILSQVASTAGTALQVMYVSPLKALINDQFRRLDGLCEGMAIPVTRWHGDAPQGAKQRLLRNPAGIILITPESIEALLVRRPHETARLFADLRYVVVDELHAFLAGARGLHLASLLHRVERLIGRSPQRVGLSATIGDLDRAAAWLNPMNPAGVQQIVSNEGRPELKLQIRGYVEPPEVDGPDELEGSGDQHQTLDDIADHLFQVLRGKNNLAFGGSRRTVEALADRLRRRSEAAKVPNEFFPHHGSLSKELREILELRLKDGRVPTTAIATSTLELGVDIGSVASVAQIGAPRSLSALRQRLGRSGRRKGVPAVLRIYVRERFIGPDADPLDRIRAGAVRAMAAVQLLVDGFVETPGEDPSLATAVFHQSLAWLVQEGGGRASGLYKQICGQPPFSALSAGEFAELLRGMAATEPPTLEQAPDGTLMLGHLGEQLVAGREFYALFESDQEWRLVADGRTLGTIPLSNVVMLGSLIGFAGRRWKVSAIDDRSKVLTVVSHASARLPKFERMALEPIDDRLTAQMRDVYLADDLPAYLHPSAGTLVTEGRVAFRELDLGARRLLASGKDTHILTWRGTHANDCLSVALNAAGLECQAHDLGVTVADTSPEDLQHLCAQSTDALTSDVLSDFVGNLRTAKYDDLIPEPLLRRLWARRFAANAKLVPTMFAEVASSPQ